ncbi:MAG: hydantoinase B/oxoprolinase family protein [Steroidobacteraceae bacterium]
MESAKLALIKTAFDSATREMAVNLQQSAISSIVREAADFSVALTDSQGEVFAQAECIPIMTAGISLAIEQMSENIDVSSLKDGDAILMNDPYTGGQHLQDIYLFMPVFHGDKLVGYSASTAHHVDIGGSHAGLSAYATEVYQEGIQIPYVRFSIERDFMAKDGFVRRMIEANVRTPAAVTGDLKAQFSANMIGATRLIEICNRFGIDECLNAMEALKDYAEERVTFGHRKASRWRVLRFGNVGHHSLGWRHCRNSRCCSNQRNRHHR